MELKILFITFELELNNTKIITIIIKNISILSELDVESEVG
jgi:hypothetical protein